VTAAAAVEVFRERTLEPIVRKPLFALITVVLMACDGLTEPILDFAHNRDKWERAHLTSYSFEFQRSCFCIPTERARITVSNGQVSSVILISTGQPPDSSSAAFYDATIDDLFDELGSALAHASQVTVTYDQALGYPRTIAIDHYANAVDDEISYEARLVP
jgi:hypothetical protein